MNSSNNKDSLSRLLISINLMLQRDRSDRDLNSLLDGRVEDIKVKRDLIYLKFKNGLIVCLSSFYDDYNLYISDISLYENEDTPFKLYGVDRVYYYLTKVCNV